MSPVSADRFVLSSQKPVAIWVTAPLWTLYLLPICFESASHELCTVGNTLELDDVVALIVQIDPFSNARGVVTASCQLGQKPEQRQTLHSALMLLFSLSIQTFVEDLRAEFYLNQNMSWNWKNKNKKADLFLTRLQQLGSLTGL